MSWRHGKGPTMLVLMCVAVALVHAQEECILLTDNLAETVPDLNDGTTEARPLYCIDTTEDDTTMMVLYHGSHGEREALIQVNDHQGTCECEECLSTREPQCHGTDKCACNMHCLQGYCSQTVAPLYPTRWYIRVVAHPGFSIKVRLFPTWELEEGAVHESSLASADPYYFDNTRVIEPTPWWDYYKVTAGETGSLTVTVRNLEDSGVYRGYVEVVMRKGAYPDREHNDAVYSTYTRDTVQAHLKNTKEGDVVYIGVLGRGNERWIRYSLHIGGFKFAVVYAVLGVLTLLGLLGVFVWFYKQRMAQVKQRKRVAPFHSAAYATDDGL